LVHKYIHSTRSTQSKRAESVRAQPLVYNLPGFCSND